MRWLESNRREDKKKTTMENSKSTINIRTFYFDGRFAWITCTRVLAALLVQAKILTLDCSRFLIGTKLHIRYACMRVCVFMCVCVPSRCDTFPFAVSSDLVSPCFGAKNEGKIMNVGGDDDVMHMSCHLNMKPFVKRDAETKTIYWSTFHTFFIFSLPRLCLHIAKDIDVCTRLDAHM